MTTKYNEPLAKPLNDNDIDLLMKKLVNVDSKKLNKLFRDYSNILNSIISLTIKITKDEDEIIELERVKRILGLCPLEERLLRTKDKIWNARNHILKKNSDFFIKRDYSSMIKQDSNQAFIESLMLIVKTKFPKLKKKEQFFYWKKATSLLKIVAEFKKMIGESV